jgi:hypothetical protein
MPLLAIVGRQLHIDPNIWPQYAQRPETRREHLAELQSWLGLTPVSISDYRRVVYHLTDLAQQTDRGIVLAETLVEMLRQQRIILPALDVIERVCGEALTRGTRQVYKALTVPLADHHRHALDGVLANREGSKPKHILAHLERLKILRELLVPDELEHTVHQNRLLKLAREGGQTTAQHLRDLEPARRYATLVATILDTRSTLIDEIIDLYDRFMGIRRDRQRGMSLGQLAREHRASRTTIHRVLHEHASASSEQVA